MNRLLVQLATLAAASVLSATIGYSQSSTVMRFDIPFAFSACERHLPAGVYFVRWDAMANLVVLEGPGQDIMFLPTGSNETPARGFAGMMHFHRYGNQAYLRGVQRDGGQRRDWPASRAEKETSKALTPTVVALVQK